MKLKPLLKKDLELYRYSVSESLNGQYASCIRRGRAKKPLVAFSSLCELVMWLVPQGLTLGKNFSIVRSTVQSAFKKEGV